MLDEKMRELIAVGASISANCEPCVTFHTAKAKELDIEPELVREAVEIGISCKINLCQIRE